MILARPFRHPLAGALAAVLVSLSGPVAKAEPDLLRQAIAAEDGWGAGTDGGSKAAPSDVFVVTNRAQLLDALRPGGKQDRPKIIQVKGTINLSVDDDNRELFEKDYADPAYDVEAYKAAYAPQVWNVRLDDKKRPLRDLTGPLEEARKRSVERQKARVVVKLTSNTTLIGLGSDAKIVKGNLVIGEGTENVIIRNITFEDAFDYFPAWDPGDSWKLDTSYPGCQEAYVNAATGPQQCPGGRWNSEYDNISINGGTRVWLDHCTFTDGERPDHLFPPVFPFPNNMVEQKVQHHDGQVDITNGADRVTLTHNHFSGHDKTSLIGGSDSRNSDAGKLNVTYRANWFDNAGQRLPRVRFGKVHSYNNYFSGTAAQPIKGAASLQEKHALALKMKGEFPVFRSGFGIGKESAIYSENNYFEIRNGSIGEAAIVQGGTRFFDRGSLVNGQPADFAAALNSDPKTPISSDLGWTPTLYGTPPIPAAEVPAYVRAHAGAGKL
ncbi:pectate lyase [Rhizobium sp. RU35A]|uniref:pectate lyase family protein n=1 Tax=Rhizobium sp. RU35A TaxID=1907414 RepID=UPI0009570008|nr:PbsX family transcriptional regulator [Rhizobium sp. RU35A]SIQ11705.1 pectate lyase [Rhizobium sp. RU35A]